MYSHDELSRLGAHKAELLLRIAVRRAHCAEAVSGVMRPIAWLDRAMIFWRQVSPVAKLAAVPLTLAARRILFPRAKLLGVLFRWGPIAFGAARSLSRARP
jgi:hypothetical protein